MPEMNLKLVGLFYLIRVSCFLILANGVIVSCLFEFNLFVYISAVNLHFSCLFTFELFVYILAVCLHFRCLFTFQQFVYISAV